MSQVHTLHFLTSTLQLLLQVLSFFLFPFCPFSLPPTSSSSPSDSLQHLHFILSSTSFTPSACDPSTSGHFLCLSFHFSFLPSFPPPPSPTMSQPPAYTPYADQSPPKSSLYPAAPYQGGSYQQQQQPQQQQQLSYHVVGSPAPVSNVTIVRTEFADHRGPCSWLLNILWILFGGGLFLFLLWMSVDFRSSFFHFSSFLSFFSSSFILFPSFLLLLLLFFFFPSSFLFVLSFVVSYFSFFSFVLSVSLILPLSFSLSSCSLLGLIFAITIIGFPLARQFFKLGLLSLLPL